MTPQDLAKIRERLDKTNDARTPRDKVELANLVLYANARRDLSRLLGYVAELERDNRALRDIRGSTEAETTYQHVRPQNHTIRPDLLMKAGSVDLPILAPVEDDISLGELVREKITGLVDVIEEWEHRRGK